MGAVAAGVADDRVGEDRLITLAPSGQTASTSLAQLRPTSKRVAAAWTLPLSLAFGAKQRSAQRRRALTLGTRWSSDACSERAPVSGYHRQRRTLISGLVRLLQAPDGAGVRIVSPDVAALEQLRPRRQRGRCCRSHRWLSDNPQKPGASIGRWDNTYGQTTRGAEIGTRPTRRRSSRLSLPPSLEQ